MARAIRVNEGLGWPAGLGECVCSDWLEPGEDVADLADPDSLVWFHCWYRWTDARYQFLLDLGMNPDDAQGEACGAFPNRNARANSSLMRGTSNE